MDVYGIEALLGLPEFRVVDQVIGPKRLELHLQRRETSIVCPRCQTCCSRVQESRPRVVHRDHLDRPLKARPLMPRPVQYRQRRSAGTTADIQNAQR